MMSVVPQVKYRGAQSRENTLFESSQSCED